MSSTAMDQRAIFVCAVCKRRVMQDPTTYLRRGKLCRGMSIPFSLAYAAFRTVTCVAAGAASCSTSAFACTAPVLMPSLVQIRCRRQIPRFVPWGYCLFFFNGYSELFCICGVQFFVSKAWAEAFMKGVSRSLCSLLTHLVPATGSSRNCCAERNRPCVYPLEGP